MAIRIDASGDYLRRTANLPTTSAFTACCWFYYVSTRSAYAFFISFENAVSSASAGLSIGFDTSNAFFVIVSSGSPATFGSNPATSAWHFVALRANGTNVKGFHRTLSGTWQTATTSSAPSFTPAVLAFGNDSYDDWVNCRLAGIKVWDAALSDAEIENEAETLRPQRFANLNLWTPGFPGSGERTRDYSGNGRNLTEGGTLTDEDAPPIAYGARSLWFPFVAAGGSTQFATFSASATGAASFVKAPTKIIPSVTGTGTGTFVKVPTKLFSSVTGTGSAAFVKTPAKLISLVTATGAASFVKVPLKIFALVTGTGAASFVKVPSKLIATLTATGAATFTTLKVRLVTFALVTATGTATFLKTPQKVFSASATGAPTFVKSVSKIISVSANGSAAFVKSAAKTFALVTATGSAAFVKGALKTFTAASSGAATFTTQTIPSVVVALRHFTVTEPTTAFTVEETNTAFTSEETDTAFTAELGE